MSKVAATGMIKLYPGVCGESRWFSHAHFFGHKLHTSRGQALYSSISQGFSYGLNDRRAERKSTFFVL
jgi:hypothetical protein